MSKKIRKTVYISKEADQIINEQRKKNPKLDYSSAVDELILISNKNSTKYDNKMRYAINDVSTKMQVILNILCNDSEIEMIDYSKSNKYRNAKRLVDLQKAKAKDKMK